MNPLAFILLAGSLTLVALSAGCEKPQASGPAAHHDHEHAHDGESEDGGATFAEGRGLRLPEEVAAALGLRTAVAEPRALARSLDLVAQVFAEKPGLRAVASIPADRAAGLAPGQPAAIQFRDGPSAGAPAELVAISRAAEQATGQVELIFALPSHPPAGGPGDAVALRLSLAAGAPALAVPRSALLDAAAGTFVYVVNGEGYLRTPVTVGTAGADHVEILEGLSAGAVVVAAPVDQLWLSELRLTKGGGHSH